MQEGAAGILPALPAGLARTLSHIRANVHPRRHECTVISARASGRTRASVHSCPRERAVRRAKVTPPAAKDSRLCRERQLSLSGKTVVFMMKDSRLLPRELELRCAQVTAPTRASQWSCGACRALGRGGAGGGKNGMRRGFISLHSVSRTIEFTKPHRASPGGRAERGQKRGRARRNAWKA